MHVPLVLKAQGMQEFLVKRFNLGNIEESQYLREWERLAYKMDEAEKEVKVGIVGKYTHLKDCYLSIIKALEHAGLALNVRVKILWIEAEALEQDESIL